MNDLEYDNGQITSYYDFKDEIKTTTGKLKEDLLLQEAFLKGLLKDNKKLNNQLEEANEKINTLQNFINWYINLSLFKKLYMKMKTINFFEYYINNN